MAFCQVCVFHGGLNIAILVPADHRARSVLDEAFGGMDTLAFDGANYVAVPGFSHGTVMEPSISEVPLSHPRE